MTEPRPIRVVHILATLRPSGAEVMLSSSRSEWSDQGFHPSVVATGHDEGEFASTLRAAGYEVSHVPGGRGVGGALRLARYIRTVRPGVVHLHVESMSFWTALVARLAAPDAVIVRSVHSVFEFSGWLRTRRAWQRRLAQNLLLVRFVAVGPAVERNERARFGTCPAVVLNWVGPQHTNPRGYHEEGSLAGYSIATVGNCSEIKRHDLLIRALALTDVQIRLTHVGESLDTAVEKNLALTLGVEQRVDFVGLSDSVPTVLRAADLVVACSRVEGFGLAVAEAICAGVPVLVTDTPGLAEFASTFAGVSKCESTPEALSEAIRRALVNGRLPIHHSDMVRARKIFSVSRGVQGYSSIYRAGAQKQHVSAEADSGAT